MKSKVPITPLDAARFLQISKPMVTAMTRSLENKGFLTKIPSPTDGRSFTLSPTQKAELIVEITAKVFFEPKKHQKKAYSIAGPEAIDYYEIAKILSGELGRK